jgi:hypothetical protein
MSLRSASCTLRVCCSKWSDGKLYYTEEEIRREHPEAVQVPGSRKVFEIPETDEERRAAADSIFRPPKDCKPF